MNFTLSYQIQNAISRFFSFAHLLPSDNLSRARVIVTSAKEVKSIVHGNIVIIHPNSKPSQIRGLILKKIKSNNGDECVFGIDPGKTIGIAILYLNEILITEKISSIEELVFWIKQQLKVIPSKNFVFKIGEGDKKHSIAIYSRLKKELPSLMVIKFVSEFKTSIRGNSGRSKHEEAAIRIAKRD